MPYADVTTSDSITLHTQYTDRDRMLLIPGTTYRNDGTWAAPLSWATCKILRSVFGGELTISPALAQWAQAEARRVKRMTDLRMALELPEPSRGSDVINEIERGTGLQLYGFQRADVGFMVTGERVLLAAGMGSGKTPVTIRTLQVLSALGRTPFPALIICPNSVKHTVWARELARWAPELTAVVIDGGASARRKQMSQLADCFIMNWDLARLHSRVAGYGDIRLSDKDKMRKELNELGLRTVIIDEAHHLFDPSSAQSRAVKFIAHEATFRYALTGTPVNKHAGDLWGILHVIAPDWHPGKTRYMSRWVETGYNLYGGLVILGLKSQNEAEFRIVTEPLYRRIPREIILPQLPPKLPVQYRETPMTPKQAKAYREMEKMKIAQLNELLTAENPLVELTRLMQFAAAHANVEYVTDAKTGKQKARVTLADPSCKVDDLVELLSEMGDEPLVVAAVSRQLAELAAARLGKLGITYGLITGAQTPAERGETVDKFQRGDIRVIILTIKAGAEGLTLTRSRVMLFMQEDWRPDLNDQAEGRILRIGSEIHESIQIIKQITPGTVEERKLSVLAGKHERIEEVIRDREVIAQLLGAVTA